MPSLRNHWFKNHKDIPKPISVSQSEEFESSTHDDNDVAGSIIKETNSYPTTTTIPPLTLQKIDKVDIGHEISKSCVQMYFEVKDVLGLPESKANKIVQLNYAFVERFYEMYSQLIKDTFEEHDIKCKDEMLHSLDLSNYFNELGSFGETSFLPILRQNFPFISPVEVCFSDDSSDKMYYIPIRETIEIVSNSLDVLQRAELFLKSKHISEYFSNLVDEAIYIKLYIDEFEVCNPIGASRTKHKISAVYFSFLNLLDEIASKLSSHFLVSLGCSS